MKIGQLARKYLLGMLAPTRMEANGPFRLYKPDGLPGPAHLCWGPTCICASACALIWFGGVDRFGQVGLHRPKITDPQFKALQPENASIVYRRVLQEISRYLEAMEAPRPLNDGMVATPSAEIRWVDYDDDNLEDPPSIHEWVDASCGSVTREERKIALSGPASTERDEMLRKTLFAKSSNRSVCQTKLVYSRRDALPGP